MAANRIWKCSQFWLESILELDYLKGINFCEHEFLGPNKDFSISTPYNDILAKSGEGGTPMVAESCQIESRKS